MTQLKKILIANRGEIACRIIRTAKKLGITTVAVFSEVDAKAIHVQMADEAYLIGPAPSKDSYLNIKKIIEIAKQSNVTAIHPGYGFLSENCEFALACEQAGILFVGPSSKAIEMMGNKNVAKEIMKQHDVPVLPGFFIDTSDINDLVMAANKIGLPIVLKAVAGGGGKGLRLVENIEDLEQAYMAVKREAKAFFNDDNILLEKYLPNARHVEVQVLADHHGAVQALYTRDCSIQRRHQKIIEEAPAPNLSDALQEKMMQAAIKGAKSIQYTNAGTFEFLLDGENFYFMEMNTRLQVEHPVTEMITELDLVEWQLRITAGEKIFTARPKRIGHAIELRLNAEDPEKDFLPSSGVLEYFEYPSDSHLRVDSGYQEGDHINIYYDSLLAKLIIWGEDRMQAVNQLRNALKEVTVFGIKTNLSALSSVINHEYFIAGNFNTHFLQQHKILNITAIPNEVYLIAATFLKNFNQHHHYHDNSEDLFSPWQLYSGWQLFASPRYHFNFENITVSITETDKNSYQITMGDHQYDCNPLNMQLLGHDCYQIELIVNDTVLKAKILKLNDKLEILYQHQYYTLALFENNLTSLQQQESENQLMAPMPGTLVALHVSSGQKVNKGDKLLVLEAMKMEHTLYAPRDGVIKECFYRVGDLIKEGSQIIELTTD